jgi:hypothetical protein
MSAAMTSACRARPDERATPPSAAGAHPVGGRHERGGARVARVLQLVDAAARPDAEEIVDEDADRLRMVDARLRRDEEHADLGGIDLCRAEEPRARRRRERDHVLARRRDRHLAHAESLRQLLRRHAARDREVAEAKCVLRHVHREPIDAHAHELPSPPPIRRQRPSAISGK